MKLTDIQPKTDAKFISRVINNYFASKVDVPALKEGNARTMLTKVKALINETKSTHKFHTSEKSPAYLQLLLMEQALQSQLKEYGADSSRYQSGTAYTSPTSSVMADIKPEDDKEDDMEEDVKEAEMPMPQDFVPEPVVAQTIKDLGPGLDPMANGFYDLAYGKLLSNYLAQETPEIKKKFQISWNLAWAKQMRELYSREYGGYQKRPVKEDKLTESEVETAQVVLAAQDMVDKIAGWTEDVADMQYKDLPGLVEMMRNEVGVNEAQAFLDAQTATLTTLLDSLEQAKTEATTAMAPLTGEQAVDPSEFSKEPDLDAGVDNDTPPDVDSDGDITEPDLEPDLGRERR